VRALIGDGIFASAPGTNGSSSFVEDEPLLTVFRLTISDSQSKLMTSDVLMPEDSSFWSRSRPDLELNFVCKRLSWVTDSLSVKEPTLVGSFVTWPPGEVTIFRVTTSIDIKTLTTKHSDVFSFSFIEACLLKLLLSELSDDNSSSLSCSISNLVADGVVSLVVSSNGLGSMVIDPPLVIVPRSMSSDSQSVLMSTNMLSPAKRSLAAHF
jgi:hypothetical protein